VETLQQFHQHLPLLRREPLQGLGARLGGEIRRVRQLGQRLREAAAVGVETMIVPGQPPVDAPPGVQILGVASLSRALGHLKPV